MVLRHRRAIRFESDGRRSITLSDSSDVAWHVGLLREREGRRVPALQAYARAASAPRGAKAEAVAAVKRLEQLGLSVPGGIGAADLKARQSSVRIGPMPKLQRGELLVSLDVTGSVGDVITLSGDVPAGLAVALKKVQIPGSDVARARQLRLFRAGSAECQATGSCTIVWHRIP